MASLVAAGIDATDVKLRKNCATQSAYIIVDASTGERTVLWRRDDGLSIHPEEIAPEQIACGRLLHIDGHDTPAVARAAAIARSAGIPVTVDVDTIYPGFDRVLPNVDYLVASAEFPAAWTGLRDPFQALEKLQNEYRMKVAAMTLGANGALAREDGRFLYSAGYVIDAVDTTGAGDVFHGAFCYAVLEGMPMRRALDFSNAMAALNCAAMGARGGIRGLEEVRALMARGPRRAQAEFAARPAAGS
jgi:sulfofructose kinase